MLFKCLDHLGFRSFRAMALFFLFLCIAAYSLIMFFGGPWEIPLENQEAAGVVSRRYAGVQPAQSPDQEAVPAAETLQEEDATTTGTMPVLPWLADVSRKPGSPSAKLRMRREKLSEWLRSVATLQEVEFLSSLRTWVSQTDPGSVAEALNKITGETGWHRCAKEHELCVCSSANIRFGRGSRWITWQRPDVYPATQTHFSIRCDIPNFGGQDPAEMQTKECQCYGVAEPLEGSAGSAAGLNPNGPHCGSACSLGKTRVYSGNPRPRTEICRRPTTHEQLWSCNQLVRRVPQSSQKEPEEVLHAATDEFCRDIRLQKFLDIYLDCDYAENYLRWAPDEWIEEAFVTYIAGEANSNFEWMATNLIRSVALFSRRPIIVVVCDLTFRPPAHWARFTNVLVYKMLPGMNYPVSFNFNKIRSMIASRVVVGVQLDVDQLVAPLVDRVFGAARQQTTRSYPFPLMPVHWMARDTRPGEMFYEYRLRLWPLEHGARWCHAHPTWTYWGLLFLSDVLLKRYLVGLTKPRAATAGRLWSLSNLLPIDAASVIQDKQAKHFSSFKLEGYMLEDEDMLNVELWLANATKAWCKFDLEPDTYLNRYWLSSRLYADSRWYPDGVPIMFLSLHNTKDFETTDRLLTILAHCSDPDFVNRSHCSSNLRQLPHACQPDSKHEKEVRTRRPDEYASQICCCLQPRQEKYIYWAGKWYANKDEVPPTSISLAPRRCLLI